MKPVSAQILLECDLAGEARTRLVARQIAAEARPGDVLALWGDLGAGKTTFARGFIGALAGDDEPVPSPTFTLVQTYQVTLGGEAAEIWHFDLYRLKQADEAYELGIEDAFAAGISLIEWPERLGNLLPRDRLDVTLSLGSAADSRHLVLAGGANWTERVARIRAVLLGGKAGGTGLT
ncbi:MAG: tRNA (adenosine(37)-N6)-threonylcarbamoyltransferase complex ATPase subunit type 1 TsaE [Rhodospirillaceae bacterium]|nr:tRNA (adenosine(37)-N6)-threonylcarbamoyltransferase complex ATPase subunit type 1 TsaE [Rhodospirillaceae bacterium]